MGGCGKDDKGKESKEGRERPLAGGKPDDGGLGPLGLADTIAGLTAGFQVDPARRIFLAVLSDKPSADLEPDKELRRRHLEHLAALTKSGKLDAAGGGRTRGIQVLVAENKQEAEELVRTDPLIQEGYYKKYTVDEVTPPDL